MMRIQNKVLIFNQISFVVEEEEIKDFVAEKVDEVKTSLDDIKTNTISTHFENIKKEITDVKSRLLGVNSEDDDYTYTLQDVESDIAKVRMILKELTEQQADISDDEMVSK